MIKGYLCEMARKLKNGAEISHVIQEFEKQMNCMEIILGPYSLKQMKKSGRISAAAAVMGELMGVRPIITLIDGKTKVESKVRGDDKVVPAMIELCKKRANGVENFDYMIGHTNIKQAEDLEKALADLCRTVAKENKVDFTDVKYVGIGTPGSVNFTTGFVGFNTNFGYYDWNLGPDLEAMLGCKVYVENDANAAAYGEYIAGGAKGYKDAVVITLGTGIGSGIILGGKILRGFNFAAGEMGHNVIVKDGIQCTCGRKGCWERYASASALTRETKVAMQAHKETIMWKMTPDLDHVNAKLSFDAAAKGDAVAKSVVDSWIEYVGVGIANVINTFEPEIICIGGGVSNQGETLLAPVRAYAENETKNITTGRFPKIVACTLHNDAGVIGAAALENSI